MSNQSRSGNQKFNKFFFNKSNELVQRYQTSSELRHRGSKGAAREIFIDTFLSELYPEKYIVGHGEIIDSYGNVSPQADIIVYDADLPVLDHGGPKQFLAEGVRAHIEVKSNFDKSDIYDALSLVSEVKNIRKSVPSRVKATQRGITYGATAKEQVYSTILTYNGASNETIFKHVRNYYDENFVRSPHTKGKGNTQSGTTEEIKTGTSNIFDSLLLLNRFLERPVEGLNIPESHEDSVHNYAKPTDSPSNTIERHDKEYITLFGEGYLLGLFFVQLASAIHNSHLGAPDMTQYLDYQNYKIGEVD